MNLEEFFGQILTHTKLRLVGPLLGGPASVDLPVIYIDGGLKYKPATPHLSFSLGDGDSSPRKPDLLFNPEKDASDLELALQRIPSSITSLQLDGFLGGRKDHEWINQGVLHRYLRERTQSQATFDQHLTALSAGDWSIPYTGTFSLLCFEDTQLSLTGDVKYKYELTSKFPALSSLGLSNECRGMFHLKNDSPVLLYFVT